MPTAAEDQTDHYRIAGRESTPTKRTELALKAGRSRRSLRGYARPAVPDPCSSDRVYQADELEFIDAMRAYQVATGRKFPSWTEALAVLRSLGYRKP